jgi:hypothetical protein
MCQSVLVASREIRYYRAKVCEGEFVFAGRYSDFQEKLSRFYGA